jgi:hypothetical protein
MPQQYIAITIIIFFLSRLLWQKKKKQLESKEFLFWFLFWFLAGIIIINIRHIDSIVAKFGFSSSGINVLFYISVVILFYFIFRIRLRQEKMEREITEIVKNIAINNKKS